jgi:hypothetical protein
METSRVEACAARREKPVGVQERHVVTLCHPLRIAEMEDGVGVLGEGLGGARHPDEHQSYGNRGEGQRPRQQQPVEYPSEPLALIRCPFVA